MKDFTRQCSAAAFAAITLFTATNLLAQQTETPPNQISGATWHNVLDHNFPRLVVVMSFDQMKADLLSRYSHQFLAPQGADGSFGGFRYLLEKGATLVDTHYNHIPLHTGPGHATIMTGASPRYSGIIANSWTLPSGQRTNCVDDPEAKTLGVPVDPKRRGSSSPKNLETNTVGDELRLSNHGLSKVYGIAIKDRGAILPSGHNANGAVWFDSQYGHWITSTYYTSGTLPTFAQKFNDEKVADRWVGKSWEYLLPEDSYKISMPEGMRGAGEARGLPSTFPKLLSEPGKPADKEYYNKMIFSPYGNEMTFETAKMAVRYEELGQDIYPDILTVSFSTTDLVGHSWGTYSREAHDTVINADRQLSDFLNYLDHSVPGGMENVLIVLTGDHGGMILPEYGEEMRLGSERILYEEVAAAANKALAVAFPDKQTSDILTFSDPHVVFRHKVCEDRGIDLEKAAEVAAHAIKNLPHITAAYTRKQIESGTLPRNHLSEMVTNGFNPDRCGEILVVTNPFYYNSSSKSGSTHGTPWSYDTHVPMIFAGNNIKPGVYTNRTDVRDIAPTLSFLLGLTAPASSEGRILTEIIK